MSAVAPTRPGPSGRRGPGPAASIAAASVLTAVVVVGVAAALATLLVLAIHPTTGEFTFLAGQINQQSQNAKTLAFVLAFVAVLPAGLVVVPRWADRIAVAAGDRAVLGLAGLAAALLAAAVVVVRLVDGGLGVALASLVVWGAATAVLVVVAARGGAVLTRRLDVVWALSGVLLLGAILALTRVASLSVAGLLVGGAIAAAVAVAARARPRLVPARVGVAAEIVFGLVLGLAVVDVVVFEPSAGLPNALTMPGIVQSQHDFFLGPINQLLSAGTLLVNAPGSQYGVGDLYVIAAWSDLFGIGYGTFALLDGLLTALFYLGGYALLRLAGVSRRLAMLALGAAVVLFVYHLQYPVGVLPEMGPLRFGLPLAVLLGELAAARWPRRRGLGHALALAALAVAAVWSVEAFAYTAFVFVGVSVLALCLMDAGGRRRWAVRRALAAVCAILTAHLIFALATLAGSGSLPHWGQYFAYVHSFLLGGKAGEVTYGFDRFSPALGLGAGLLAASAALLVVVLRAREVVRRAPLHFLGFGGSLVYAVAVYSYTDNRSSTYLLPYLALPALLATTIGLDWLWRSESRALVRGGMLALAGALGAVMLAAAWPTIGPEFSQSALAKARPGGGLVGALRRLHHAPPIDPRTPVADGLLARYVPQGAPIVLLADASDLGIEALMHAHRANGLAIGDSGMDSYVPSNWTGRIGAQIAAISPGTRMLTDAATLRIAAQVAARPGLDPINHPLGLGRNQMEWILARLQRRFTLRPLARDPSGLVVAELVAR